MFVVTQLNLEKLAEVLERVLFSFWQSCNIKKKKRSEKTERDTNERRDCLFFDCFCDFFKCMKERREVFFVNVWGGSFEMRVWTAMFTCVFWVKNLVCLFEKRFFFFLWVLEELFQIKSWLKNEDQTVSSFFLFRRFCFTKNFFFYHWALLLFDGPGIRLTGERARWLAEHLIFWGVRCASDNPWKSRGKNHSLAQSYS